MNLNVDTVPFVILNVECLANNEKTWVEGKLYIGKDSHPNYITIGSTSFKYESRNIDNIIPSARPGCVIYKYLYRRMLHGQSIADYKDYIHNIICEKYGDAIANHVVANKYSDLIVQEVEKLMSFNSIASLIMSKLEDDFNNFFNDD